MEHLNTSQSDEPKHTKAAAYITNIYQDRLLVLWRKKWESEGTPLILPGGGANDGENLLSTAIREAEEEIGLTLSPQELFNSYISWPTKWTNMLTIFNVIPPVSPNLIKLDSIKFSGVFWIPVNNKQIMGAVKPLCMPGLKQLIEYMRWD